MDVAAWSLEIARIVGPFGAVLLLWLVLRSKGGGIKVAPISLSQEPPPGVDRMIELLTEIRDGVRDQHHQHNAMAATLERVERRQSGVR